VASQTTGLYGLASVLLLKDRLPPRPRSTLGAALGGAAGLPFRALQDGFDAVYVASAVTTAVVLGISYWTQRAAIRGDAQGS
jgi:hypothetical protein